MKWLSSHAWNLHDYTTCVVSKNRDLHDTDSAQPLSRILFPQPASADSSWHPKETAVAVNAWYLDCLDAAEKQNEETNSAMIPLGFSAERKILALTRRDPVARRTPRLATACAAQWTWSLETIPTDQWNPMDLYLLG